VAEVFGEPADFAIEAGVEPHLVPPSAVWGHMRVWCRGVPLGDIESRHDALYPARANFEEMAARLDALWAPEFDRLDDVAAWNFLDELLYGYHNDVEVFDDRTAEDCRAYSMRWGRHNFLTNWGVPFDGCKGFALAPPPGDRVRILVRSRPAYELRRFDVTVAGFAAASEGFVRWFDAEEARLGG
jgi:hypothetical protein